MDESQLRETFENATEKQVEVLGLAAEGLTSKQIAIELDIAPRSVDQRIDNLRSKMGGVPRGDLVRSYRHWMRICGRTTYDPITLTSNHRFGAEETTPKDTVLVFNDAVAIDDRSIWDHSGRPRWPGLEPSDLSPLAKLVAVFAVALALLIGFSLIIATAQGVTQLLGALGGS